MVFWAFFFVVFRVWVVCHECPTSVGLYLGTQDLSKIPGCLSCGLSALADSIIKELEMRMKVECDATTHTQQLMHVLF